MDRDVLAGLLAEGRSLEEIGRLTGLHPSTVGYWVAKHGLHAVNRQRHLPRGSIEQGALAAEVARGLSVAELAEGFERSKSTIRYWLREYGLETLRAERYRRRRETAKLAGGVVLMHCDRHGLTEFGRRKPNGFRCLRCRAEAVTRRRRVVKATLVAEAGGRCAACGYDRSPAALAFHHRDPSSKRFALSQAGVSRSIERARTEAAKCVLLCANCHAEVEAGTLALS